MKIKSNLDNRRIIGIALIWLISSIIFATILSNSFNSFYDFSDDTNIPFWSNSGKDLFKYFILFNFCLISIFFILKYNLDPKQSIFLIVIKPIIVSFASIIIIGIFSGFIFFDPNIENTDEEIKTLWEEVNLKEKRLAELNSKTYSDKEIFNELYFAISISNRNNKEYWKISEEKRREEYRNKLITDDLRLKYSLKDDIKYSRIELSKYDYIYPRHDNEFNSKLFINFIYFGLGVCSLLFCYLFFIKKYS